jgi:ribonuclease Z
MASKIKINFLGTAAQIPTIKRNHTGILLTYNEENILIDCGEGIQRQFRIAKLNPNKITKILLTHLHGDHTFGLPGLLSTLAFSEYNKTLEIYGPKGTKKYMDDFMKLFGIDKNLKTKIIEIPLNKKSFFENKEFELFSESMKHGTPTNAYSFKIKDKLRINKLKLKKLKMPQGKHLSELLEGKTITLNGKKYKPKDLTYKEQGKKVSIVLDTLYNEKIAPFVKGSDLLICESSFSSENSKEAEEHLHMTSEQAGKIAKLSKSKKLILTHISQRYEYKTKSILEDAKKHFKNVSIAKDFDETIL